MAPILFRIPLTLPYVGHFDLPIYGFGMMLVLAFIFSPWLAWWRARREGLDGDVVLDMGFWVFIAGLVGARTFYCIEYWGSDIHSLLDAFQYWKGGIVYYGGIIGGAIGFFVYRRFNPFPVRPYLDVVAPSIAVGTFFGRLGCFLNGCCYGDQCTLPWAVSFPARSAAWWHQFKAGLVSEGTRASLPVHPTQLYSALDALVLLVLLTAYYPMRRRDGEVMGVLMLAYPVTRILIEYIRNDESVFFAHMTISQNISVFLFAAGLVYWAWVLRSPPGKLQANLAEQPPGRAELAAARP